MSTNTKLAEALRRIVNTFPIPVEGVEQADRASLRIALFTAREAIAAHDAEQEQEPVAWRVWRGDSYELFFNEEAAKRRCECFIRKGKPEPLYAAPVEQAAKAVPADLLPSTEHIKEIASELVKQAMEQAQVFASSWALVGSRFDAGNELDNAEQQKADLRTIIQTLADLAAETVRPIAAPTPPAPEAKSCLITGTCKHGSWCSEVYCQEHCQFVEAQAAPEAQQPAGRASVDDWERELSAVMPADFKDWWQNSRREWPAVAAEVIKSLRLDRDAGWEVAALAQRREPLTDEQIAEGRYLTWAAEPDDAPEAWSFLRGARWAESALAVRWGVKLAATTGKEPGNV